MLKKKATYRCATPNDALEIFGLLKTMHEEVGMMGFSERKVMQTILTVIDKGLAFVAEDEGRLVASVGVIPSSPWYTDDVMLAERWMYVVPGYRRSRIMRDLLIKAKIFREKTGLPMMLGVFGKKDVERKNALFRRMFKPAGEFFVEGFDVLQ